MADGSLVERLTEKYVSEIYDGAVSEGDDEPVVRFFINAIADELEQESCRLTASTLTQGNRLKPPSSQWLRAQASTSENDD